ncbi:HNH endonuclease, partial [Paenarthrobacter sp. CC6]
MEALGQLTAARVASSPAVAALTASCSRQSPGNFQWIKGSTAVATAIGHFHGVGLLSREGTTSRGSDGGKPAAPAGPDLAALLEDGQALLDTARLSFAEQAPLFDLAQAADLAGRIEDISRSIEYLQVVAAQAVERTRTEAQRAVPAQQSGQSPASGAQEWRTGWTGPAGESEGGVGGDSVPAGGGGSVLDDGYRNAAEFLRARLRIG